MKTNTILFLLIAFLASCSSLPKGSNILGPMFEKNGALDLKDGRSSDLNKGRPIYIKAVAYKHFLKSGDIRDDHFIYLNIGRENLSLKDLLGTEEGESVK